MEDLKGQVALVTGGTRGLGLAIAWGLARAGARIFLVGRSAETVAQVLKELRASGHRVAGCAWDVADAHRAGELVDRVIAELGGLDILVNNAGIIERDRTVDLELDSWDRVLATNLSGSFALARAAGATMVRRGEGLVVNISSVLGRSGAARVASYATSKGALDQLTRCLAVEWAGSGVRVNAIAAGYFSTELSEPAREDPVYGPQLLERVPLGRWGDPEEIVGPLLFLVSPASSYVTGSVLAVDGGWGAT